MTTNSGAPGPNSRSSGRVRLREAAAHAVGTPQAAMNGAQPPAQAVPLQPLRVSGVVVRKADLIDALRVYVPALSDIQVTEDGEHYWLVLDEPGGAPASDG